MTTIIEDEELCKKVNEWRDHTGLTYEMDGKLVMQGLRSSQMRDNFPLTFKPATPDPNQKGMKEYSEVNYKERPRELEGDLVHQMIVHAASMVDQQCKESGLIKGRYIANHARIYSHEVDGKKRIECEFFGLVVP